MEQRRVVQADFAGDAQVLLSTDAGGEGLNLQFCHIIFNYDLPWNPMRIEQRIGRVDRIGQAHEVTAVNLVFDGTVEHRIREVLEAKLATILAEFGVDKTGDVLETVEAGAAFDKLYAEVVVSPDQAAARVDALVAEVRARAVALRTQAKMLAEEDQPLDPEPARLVLNHPLPGWVETLVLRHLEATGGRWSVEDGLYRLWWADGSTQEGVFEPAEAARRSVALLSIQDSRIRRLAIGLGGLVSGQPIPVTDWPGLTGSVEGVLALYRIGTSRSQKVRILPLFQHADGRVLAPTARTLWERLIVSAPMVTGYRTGENAAWIKARMNALARTRGLELYQELKSGGEDLPRLECLLMLVVRQEGR